MTLPLRAYHVEAWDFLVDKYNKSGGGAVTISDTDVVQNGLAKAWLKDELEALELNAGGAFHDLLGHNVSLRAGDDIYSGSPIISIKSENGSHHIQLNEKLVQAGFKIEPTPYPPLADFLANGLRKLDAVIKDPTTSSIERELAENAVEAMSEYLEYLVA